MSYGTNLPWGLKPVRYMNGAAWNDQVTPYQIPSGYTAGGGQLGLYRYDPLTPANPGTGLLTIAAAGAGNVIIGSATAFQWLDPVTGQQVFSDFWPNGQTTFNATPATVFVADDPMIVFNMQAGNTGTTTIVTANLLRNIDLVAANGSAYDDLSGWALDQTTVGTAANKQMKIIRFVPTADGTNVSGLVFNNVECLINNHYYKAGVASV